MILVVPVDIITFEGRPNNITIGLEAEAVKLYSAGCAEVSMVLEETLIEDGSSHASSRVRMSGTPLWLPCSSRLWNLGKDACGLLAGWKIDSTMTRFTEYLYQLCYRRRGRICAWSGPSRN